MDGMAKRKRRPSTADSVVEEQLDEHVKLLQEATGGDILSFQGPIYRGMDDLIRDAIEDRHGQRKTRKPLLSVVIETPGGLIEVAQRIVETLRRYYLQVDFIVPNTAMSAGTVLVLSGDAIWMDYYSVLGPIDPQIKKGGRFLPALGYLEQYDRLIKKSASKKGLTTAEVTFLIQKFDPGELYQFEQARDLSITLLKEWLVKYKFKNWKVTKTHKRKVTKEMRVKRATEVAEILNNTAEWHSHGRGISMDVLRRKVRLEINDFEGEPNLNRRIRSYYTLLRNYMIRRGQTGVIHTQGRYVSLFS